MPSAFWICFVVGFFAGAVVACCAGWDSAPPVWAMAGALNAERARHGERGKTA